MRISDWSSDVCASDLQAGLLRRRVRRRAVAAVPGLGVHRAGALPAREETRGAAAGPVGGAVLRRLRVRVLPRAADGVQLPRSAEHTSELQSLMPIPSAIFWLKQKKIHCNGSHSVTNSIHEI